MLRLRRLRRRARPVFAFAENVERARRRARRQKSGPSILRNFAGTPDIVMGFVDKLGNNTGVTVRSGVFS